VLAPECHHCSKVRFLLFFFTIYGTPQHYEQYVFLEIFAYCEVSFSVDFHIISGDEFLQTLFWFTVVMKVNFIKVLHVLLPNSVLCS
jgi:hypothetical protein